MMKTVALAKGTLLKVSVKPITITIILLLILFSATLVIVRGQCIMLGYEISSLASQIERDSIKYEMLKREYYSIVRTETLVNKAKDFGFILPEKNKVFYVK